MSALPPVGLPDSAPRAAAARAWAPHRFRAPQEDSALALEWIGGDLAQSQDSAAALAASDLNLQGRTLGRLRTWAREDCLRAAADYTSCLVDAPVSAPAADLPLFVAGHQPQLFHPGVWAKNFVLGGLAKQTGGAGLNLIVDNDTLTRTGILVPVGSADNPRFEPVNYDEPRLPQPWEDARIIDRQQFDTFADRINTAMTVWGVTPVLGQMWPDARRIADRGGRLVDALVAARRCQEGRWGLSNLELPVSRLCEQRSFLWFASHLLAQLPSFREIHNAVLWDYRQVNKIRSRSHPVPELGEQDGWLEAPFWVWRAGDHRRRHVFARQVGPQMALSDGTTEFARIPLGPEREACCAVEALEQLPARGIRFRTRALTTTLFARVILGDLFVHGIGGAKYDEMTDRIIARFYGLTPPPFLMATATLRLPLPMPSASVATDVGRLRHALRDAQFNPERRGAPASPQWTDRKRTLIDAQHAAVTTGLTRAERRGHRTGNRERSLAFRDLRHELAATTQSLRESLDAQLQSAEQQTAARAVLASREYSACLFPEVMLTELFDHARRHVQTGSKLP